MLGHAGRWNSFITGSVTERHGRISRARLLKCELTCDHRLYEDVLDTLLLLRASSSTVQEREKWPVRSSIPRPPASAEGGGWLARDRAQTYRGLQSFGLLHLVFLILDGDDLLDLSKEA
eukprot:scaffold7467_cov807-Prasinococcus_capsulatus_cf.AAC.1